MGNQFPEPFILFKYKKSFYKHFHVHVRIISILLIRISLCDYGVNAIKSVAIVSVAVALLEEVCH